MTILTPIRALRSYLIMLLFGLAAVLHPASAQTPIPPLDEASAGTSYIIAFPDTTTNAIDPRYPNTRIRPEFSLWLYSSVANKVGITRGAGATTSLNLDAGKFKVHNLPGDLSVTSINVKSGNTVKVESEHPIILYCAMVTTQGMEAWTPIPVDRWGMEYHTASVPHEIVRDFVEATDTQVTGNPKGAPAEILVIAAHDNTLVTFTPPPLVMFRENPSRTITLNAGEAFQVQSLAQVDELGGAESDIAGTMITSDKPIGVLSGNTRAGIDRELPGVLRNAHRNLLIEWLAPSEQHGTEFVFMPTWDARRPSTGAPSERKREYVRLYSTQNEVTTGHQFQPGGDVQIPFTIRRDTLAEFAFGAPQAVFFRTAIPAQAFMHSSATLQKVGGSCFPDSCATYEMSAPYMVEMVPREQWTTFAPYYAPMNPNTMNHYVNVVTDTISARNIYRGNGTPFLFNRKIPGTDLIWGSMAVVPGESNYLVGKNGAKFYAFAYGGMKGSEDFRPSEYEEASALAYGYPLAPARNVLRSADSITIDTTMGCAKLTIKAEAVNQNPSGFRSVTLETESAFNARLILVDPVDPADIVGRSRIEAMVVPVNPLQSAGAVVILRDRTGKTWRVYYSYEPEFVMTDPSGKLDFGTVERGVPVEKVITITNPLPKNISVKEIRLALGDQGYTITGTIPEGPAKVPAVPVELAPGENIKVTIGLTAAGSGARFVDTLKTILECSIVTVTLDGSVAMPIIEVDDIDFGSFILGVDGPRSRKLKICNTGNADLTFDNPNDPNPRSLLEWIDSRFTVNNMAQIEALKTMTLAAGQCYEEIEVTFTPTTIGTFRTIARVHASTRDTRDTSIWSALVDMPSSVDDAATGSGYTLAVAGYDRGGDMVELRYALGTTSHARLDIHDALGRRVTTLLDGNAESGTHTILWDASSFATGIYYCRMAAGNWSRTVPVVVRH